MFRKFLLWVVFRSEYKYLVKCIKTDPRLATSHQVDLIVRKDGRDLRFEADWIKVLGRMYPQKEPLDDAHLTPPVVLSRTVSEGIDLRRVQIQGRPRR